MAVPVAVIVMGIKIETAIRNCRSQISEGEVDPGPEYFYF
jgi:hypothetical protein